MTAGTALFDLDGTLTDPAIGITSCIAHALESLGAPVPARDELKDWIGAPLRESFADFLSSERLADEALALYWGRFADVGLYENTPYPGIEAALASIRSSVGRTFVVTSKPTVFARQIAEHFGLDAYFDEVHGSELDGRFVDKSDLLAHVISRHRLDADTATMIGDRRFDVRAAKRQGTRSIGVLWGFGDRAELEEAGADLLCPTVDDLPRVFDGAG